MKPCRLLARRVRFVIGACALTIAVSSLSAQEADKPQPTKHVFKDGEAQVVEGFSKRQDWIRHDLWVEAAFDSDGDGKPDRLHVAVTRPKQTDTEDLRVPVVYETSPYFAGTGSLNRNYFWDPKHEVGAKPPKRSNLPPIRHRKRRIGVISNSQIGRWLPRGYAVVHSSSPGTGLSQGCVTVGGANESLAPKTVIDWLNGRAKGFTTVDGKREVFAFWCTGKVGMTGSSYNGTLPLAAATTGVPGLEAIIPIAANTSYYHYYRSNGLVRHPGGYMGEDIDVLYDFINSGRPERRSYCNDKIRDQLMAENQDRTTGDYNDFWAARDYVKQLHKLRAATLLAHGLNDWNVMPAHSARVYAALRKKGVPCQIYFHQGAHGGAPPMKQMNRWFTRYLFGIKNGVEKDPHAWIVREKDRNSKPTPYADYPNPQASVVTLYPATGGLSVGSLLTKAKGKRGKETLIDDVSVKGSKLAQAEESEHRLLYATPELRAPLHISGTARLTIRLSCNKPAANLSVWLVSLPWTRTRRITDNLITRGWADPQNHKSLTKSAPLEPGKFYDLSFDLQPDDQVIPVGARIGLMIFSSDRDFTLWPKPGTKLTIDLAGTSIDLPVVGGAMAFAKAITGKR